MQVKMYLLGTEEFRSAIFRKHQRANDEEHTTPEIRGGAYRSAVIGGRKRTLWVMNRRADHWPP